MKNKITFYEILVFVAYGFFLLLGLTWFIVSLVNHKADSSWFNPWAFIIVVAFGIQFYYRHKLTNLILGVLSLFFSIWLLMAVIEEFDLMAKGATYDSFIKGALCFGLISVIMSVIIIFGYTKLSFKDR